MASWYSEQDAAEAVRRALAWQGTPRDARILADLFVRAADRGRHVPARQPRVIDG